MNKKHIRIALFVSAFILGASTFLYNILPATGVFGPKTKAYVTKGQ